MSLLSAILGLHVYHYWFLTDDAFISFRYARNLAEGAGLTFNPGSKPVEGYTNFLWVVVLAWLARLGWNPERASLGLSVLATSLLWLGVAAIGLRWRNLGRWSVVGLIMPLALSLNRSFAVWTSGGLETRFAELFVLAGLTTAFYELRRPALSPAALPSVLFALAVLTRPDTLFIAIGVLVARDVLRWRTGCFHWGLAVPGWLVFAIPIVAQGAWRLAYYGYVLPNTYYAKLSDQSDPVTGGFFLAFFLVEYGLFLWIPYLVEGARWCGERAGGLAVLLAAGLGPYILYVVCAGGDHFEFRLLDVLWLPLVFGLQAGVARMWGRTRKPIKKTIVVAGAIIVVMCSTILPALSNVGYPEGPLAGFPGREGRSNGDRSLIQLQSVPPVLRLPGVRLWIECYNALARRLTRQYVAIRQESHRQTSETTMALGHELRRLVADGYIPEDTRIALHAAGAIPYYSRLWTLDRLGLCDDHIAHARPTPGLRMLAHSKITEPWYIAMMGVDLSAVHPFSFVVADRTVERTRQTVEQVGSSNYFVARLGPDANFLAHFPQGRRGLSKFPRMRFVPIHDWQPAGVARLDNERPQ